MALQTSGEISLSDVQGEFGGSNPIGLNEYYGVDSGVPSSGEISLSNFYGKTNFAVPSGLVSYYPLGSNANATIGTNGTVSGSVSFNGTNAIIGSGSYIHGTGMTDAAVQSISFWIKTGEGFALGNNDRYKRFALYSGGSTSGFTISWRWRDGATTGTYNYAKYETTHISGVNTGSSKWVHIYAGVSKGTYKDYVYVNGVESVYSNHMSSGVTSKTFTNDIELGYFTDNNDATRYLPNSTSYSKFRAYNRDLSVAEIGSIYQFERSAFGV